MAMLNKFACKCGHVQHYLPAETPQELPPCEKCGAATMRPNTTEHAEHLRTLISKYPQLRIVEVGEFVRGYPYEIMVEGNGKRALIKDASDLPHHFGKPPQQKQRGLLF